MGVVAPRRHRATKRLAALRQVPHRRRIRIRLVELERLGLGVGQRQVEAVAELAQGIGIELLLLVGRHPALSGAAHAEALLGVRKDHCRLSDMPGGGKIRRMQLDRVVAAAGEAVDLLVGHALRQCPQRLVLPEEALAVELAVGGGEGLELAVDRRRKGIDQRAVAVAGKQPVPIAAPHELDHVPAGTEEQRLELVDDASVAAHRPVQALQVAVDDEDEVVELLARRQRECAHRLRLVHLAVAEDAPHLARQAVLEPGGAGEAAMFEVADETGLVDGADRADAHRAGRKLPELGHQPRMRIAGQAARTMALRGQFLPVVRQVLLAEPALEESPRVDAGCRMRLEVDQVAQELVAPGAKEVVEADLEKVGSRRVAGDVAAEFAVGKVGTHHHRERVPAHDRRQLPLEFQVPRKARLRRDRDRVHERRRQRRAPAEAGAGGMPLQRVEQEAGTLRPPGLAYRLKRIEPFDRFLRIRIGNGRRVGRIGKPRQLGHFGLVAGRDGAIEVREIGHGSVGKAD